MCSIFFIRIEDNKLHVCVSLPGLVLKGQGPVVRRPFSLNGG